MNTEIWKDIYFNGEVTGKVSNAGNVLDNNGSPKHIADNGAGYLSVNIGSYRDAGNKVRTKRGYLHRLVATYLLDNPDNLPQENHKDCNKSNNHVDNLEWISASDNIKHAHKEGRMIKRTTDAAIVVLTVDQVKECYTRVKSGEGLSEVARSMNKPRTTISSILNKRSRIDITDVLDAEMSH